MKIVISDCDHESMSVEERLFAESGLAYTHLACRTEDEVIDRVPRRRHHHEPVRAVHCARLCGARAPSSS